MLFDPSFSKSIEFERAGISVARTKRKPGQARKDFWRHLTALDQIACVSATSLGCLFLCGVSPSQTKVPSEVNRAQYFVVVVRVRASINGMSSPGLVLVSLILLVGRCCLGESVNATASTERSALALYARLMRHCKLLRVKISSEPQSL